MSDLIGSDRLSAQPPIDAQAQVTLHFALSLAPDANADGALIDRTPEEQPATFAMGDGSLLPGFEAQLLGLRAGESRVFELPAEQAFGERTEDNVRRLPQTQFKDMALEPGLLVSFASPDGELPGLVKKVDSGQVTIDFNHPLAGRTIWFSVDIVAVERIS